ncbi:MAG: hypothetical protein ACKO7W_24950, partial [Elainella sp.]
QPLRQMIANKSSNASYKDSHSFLLNLEINSKGNPAKPGIAPLRVAKIDRQITSSPRISGKIYRGEGRIPENRSARNRHSRLKSWGSKFSAIFRPTIAIVFWVRTRYKKQQEIKGGLPAL